MQGWYNQGRCMLTQTEELLIRQQPRMRTVELVWTSMALPKHTFITWVDCTRKITHAGEKTETTHSGGGH